MRAIVGAILSVSTLVVVAACGPGKATSGEAPVTVFAAASTTEVMREAGRRFEQAAGIEVVFSFDSSSNLARQIKAGSPADVFISADEFWMDELAAAGLICAGTRRDLLANDLVMIAPIDALRFDVEVTSDFDFAARLPQIQRIAVGDPAHVPAGRYARQALESLGWWESLKGRLVPTLDVRSALRLVELDEVDAGIVYATDAHESAKVVVVARFSDESHEPIRYPMALCRDSASARQFIDFLTTPEVVVDVFERAGFRMLGQPKDGGG